VAAPYRTFYQGHDDVSFDEIDDPTDRLPAGKIWVVSLQSLDNTDRQPGTRHSWFTGASADIGPYDGVPYYMASVVSLLGAATEYWWNVRIFTDASTGSSEFTLQALKWSEANDIASVNLDATEVVNVLSIGSMDASRIS
jgi:hypothetical protein